MTTEVQIRPFQLRQDLLRVLSFQCDLYESNFPDFECTPGFLLEQEQRLRQAHADPSRNGLYVAEARGQVVGFLWLVLRPTGRGRLTGCVDQIYLVPEFRGRGIGRRLMLFAEEFFRSRGASKARLQVTTSNAAAVHLYESLGYTVIRYDMEKPL